MFQKLAWHDDGDIHVDPHDDTDIRSHENLQNQTMGHEEEIESLCAWHLLTQLTTNSTTNSSIDINVRYMPTSKYSL